MSTLFLIVSLLSFPAIIYFIIRWALANVSHNKLHQIKMLKMIGVSASIMFLSFILFLAIPGSDAEKNKEIEIEQNVVAKEPEVVKDKPKKTILVPKKAEPTLSYDQIESYLEDTLDPLVRSVSSNIDLNWGFYMIEPIERLNTDNDLERFRADIGLLISLYKGIIQQINDSPVPNLKETEKQRVEKIKSELKNSISKRIEIAESLIEKSTVANVLNTDVKKALDESNDHLLNASNEYKTLVQ